MPTRVLSRLISCAAALLLARSEGAQLPGELAVSRLGFGTLPANCSARSTSAASAAESSPLGAKGTQGLLLSFPATGRGRLGWALDHSSVFLLSLRTRLDSRPGCSPPGLLNKAGSQECGLGSEVTQFFIANQLRHVVEFSLKTVETVEQLLAAALPFPFVKERRRG